MPINRKAEKMNNEKFAVRTIVALHLVTPFRDVDGSPLETPVTRARIDAVLTILDAERPSAEEELRQCRAVLGVLAGVRRSGFAATKKTFARKVRDLARSALWSGHSHNGAKCESCGLPYQGFPCDLLVSDQLWLTINYGRSDGLLCPGCMCSRLVEMFRVGAIKIDEAALKQTGACDV